MGYYEDEVGFYEPSDYDIMVDKFKETLRESVKKEYQEEMARLKAENEELQEVKKNMDSIKAEHRLAMQKLEFERQDLVSKVRRERLSKLMEDNNVVLYKPDYKLVDAPKCDKCDDKRRLHFKTPRGKDEYEYCECATKEKVYMPRETFLYEFRLDRYGKELVAFYRRKDWNDDEDYMQLEDYSSLNEGVYQGEDFESVKRYSVMFKEKEECQGYCEYLNKLEKDR